MEDIMIENTDKAPDKEQATEELAANDEPYTDEERAAMSPEQRAEVERIEQAIEEFVARTKTYLQTPGNRKAILGFINDHDLRITPTSLRLAFEELSEAGELELKSEQKNQGADEQPDVSACLATSLLARGNRSVEEEETTSQEPPELEEPKTARGKPIVAWRNGKRVLGVGS